MNLSRRDADVAIRITGEPPPSLIGRKIARVAVCAYGAVGYLRARPGPDAPRDWIGWRGEAYNRLFITDPFAHARIKHRVDDIQAMHTMTRHGLGLAALPCHMAGPDPALRRIVSEPILDGTSCLWILFHPDVKQVARVRLFVEFLVERLLSFRSLFEGGEPQARTAGAPPAGKCVMPDGRLAPVSPAPAQPCTPLDRRPMCAPRGGPSRGPSRVIQRMRRLDPKGHGFRTRQRTVREPPGQGEPGHRQRNSAALHGAPAPCSSPPASQSGGARFRSRAWTPYAHGRR